MRMPSDIPAVSVALIGKLAYWQVGQRAWLTAMARQQTTVQDSQASRRGTIYDRSGTVVLASTVDGILHTVAGDLDTEQRHQV